MKTERLLIKSENERLIKYAENDLVAIKRTQLGPGFQLANKYLGPYSVVKVLRNDWYLVQKVVMRVSSGHLLLLII